MHGVVGPLASGNCYGSAGQCSDELLRAYPNEGYTVQMLAKLHAVWTRWHLNSMRAGSPAQEQWRRDHSRIPFDYEQVSRCMMFDGVNPDPDYIDPTTQEPYVYGSGWIHEDVPTDVISWLFSLPTACVESAGFRAWFPWAAHWEL